MDLADRPLLPRQRLEGAHGQVQPVPQRLGRRRKPELGEPVCAQRDGGPPVQYRVRGQSRARPHAPAPVTTGRVCGSLVPGLVGDAGRELAGKLPVGVVRVPTCR